MTPWIRTILQPRQDSSALVKLSLQQSTRAQRDRVSRAAKKSGQPPLSQSSKAQWSGRVAAAHPKLRLLLLDPERSFTPPRLV